MDILPLWQHQQIHDVASDAAAIAHDPERLDLYTWTNHAVAQVFGHVHALLLVIPASASAAALGVNFASHQRFVIIFLWGKKWFVGKLFALGETAAVLVYVALQIRVDGS